MYVTSEGAGDLKFSVYEKFTLKKLQFVDG